MNTKQLIEGVRTVADMAGAREATYCFEGRFAVQLDAGWSLVVSADDADRFRLDACLSGRRRATMWCLASDRARLADLAVAARDEAAALAV